MASEGLATLLYNLPKLRTLLVDLRSLPGSHSSYHSPIDAHYAPQQ
jgi:hypothetical protein